MESSWHSSLSAKAPLFWVFLPHKGFMGPLNWEGTPGKPEVCPAKRHSYPAALSRVLVSAFFRAAHCALQGAWLEWLSLTLRTGILTPHTLSTPHPLHPTLPNAALHTNALNLVFLFCHFREGTLYIYWVSGFEALSLELAIGKMTVCCITPFNKPHFIQGKWKTFLWFAN